MLKNKILMPNHKKRKGEAASSAVFLAVALVALVIICVFVYVLLFGRDQDMVVTPQAAPSEAMIKATAAINKKLPQEQEKMGSVDAGVFKGRWVSMMGQNKIAELVFAGDQFEIIYTADPQGRMRKYSRGRFTYNPKKGVLNLRPSRADGEPAPIRGVTYSVLTMRAFDVEVKRQNGDDALYFIAEKETVLSKRVHPLFLYADYTGAPVLKFSKAQ